MPTVPDQVNILCPDCHDEIVCSLEIAPMPGTDGAKLMAWVPNLAAPLEQHMRDAGHIADEMNVEVKVQTLSAN